MKLFLHLCKLILSMVPIRIRRFLKGVLPHGFYDRSARTVSWIGSREQRLEKHLFFAVPPSFYGRHQYPTYLGISLTSRCNLRCFFCRREWFDRGDLKFENIFKLERAIKYANIIQLSFDGEPLLYPKFPDVLRYIYSINDRKDLIHIVTNGTRLSGNVASLLHGHLGGLDISLNAASEETYNRDMKYGNFRQTVSAVRAFLSELDEWERRKVILSFVVHTANYHEMPEFVSLASDLGISAVFVQSYRVVRAEEAQLSILNIKDNYNAMVDKALDIGAKLGVKVNVGRFSNFSNAKEFDYRACLKPFQECWIMSNGDLVACCFSDGYIMGNAYRSTFEAAWFGEAYRRLRNGQWLPACPRCLAYRPFTDYVHHIHPRISGSEESQRIIQHYEAR